MAIPGYGCAVAFGTTGSEVNIPGVVSININAAPRDILDITDLNSDYQKVRPGRAQAPSITVVCHYASIGLPAAIPASVPTWYSQSLKITYSDSTTDTWKAFINGTPSISVVGDSTVEVTYEFQANDSAVT